MSFFKVVVLFFLTFGLSSAEDCPKADPQIDFNLTAYAGVWYEVYRHDINEEGYKCTNETLLANPNGTYTVWLQDISQSAGYHSRHGSAEAGIPSEPAGIVMYVDNPKETIKYNIITTDYKQYSLIYSCDYVPILKINFQHIWILSRNKTLSADVVKDLQRILKNMGARADEIVPTTQDC
jgi:lipocalin